MSKSKTKRTQRKTPVIKTPSPKTTEITTADAPANTSFSLSALGVRLITAWQWLGQHKVQLIVFFAALVVLFFRRPDALMNAQFWAEDAKWFSEAVNSGNSLMNFFHPYAGYFTSVQRLIAFIADFFPLSLSPLIYNLCALSVEALVLVYLWSDRVKFATKEMKVFLSFVLICLPYSEEIHANVTNAQWYLGMLVFLILFMDEPRHWLMKRIDNFLVLLGSLSGPFAIFLMPILIFDAIRKRRIPLNYYLIAFGAVVQVLCLHFTRPAAGDTNMGYSVTTFFQIIGGQVFGSGLFGYHSLSWFFHKPWIAPVVGLLGIQLLIYVLVKASWTLRYFIIFAAMLFAAALVSTLGTPPNMTWWYYFTTEAFGGRYYVMLHLAVFIALGWLVLTKVHVQLWLRAGAGIVLALAFLIGVPHDFEHRPYIDFTYKAYIRQYEQLKPGQSIAVPVNPGEFWHAGLTKR